MTTNNKTTYFFYDKANESNSPDCREAYKKLEDSNILASCDEKKPNLESVDFLEETQSFEFVEFTHEANQDPSDTFAHEEKFLAASILETIELIKDKRSTNSICLSSYPKVEKTYYSTIALSLQKILEEQKVSKILVFTLAPDHSTALQKVFYNDTRLLNISLHRDSPGSGYTLIGNGKATGYNINIPLATNGQFEDADLMCFMHRIIMPIAYEFNPDLVVFLPGFKSNFEEKADLISSPKIYGYLIRYLMALANGRFLCILNDRFRNEIFSNYIVNILSAMSNKIMPTIHDIDLTNIHTETFQLIKDVTSYLRLIWKNVTINENTGLQPYPSDFNIYNYYTPNLKVRQKKKTEPVDSNPEDDLIKSLSRVKIEGDTPKSSDNKVSIIYDEFLEKHSDPEYPDHPESPMRTKVMWEYLQKEDLISRCYLLKESRLATKEELLAVHTPRLVESLEKFSDEKKFDADEALKFSNNLDSIFLNKDSIKCAKMACGNLLNLVDDICLGNNQYGVGIVRPPGHHAERDRAMGFCFYNNIGVTVRYAQKKYSFKRVLVLDWDVHHGNGTQDVFKDDPNVLYLSMHRYDHGKFYPSDPEGDSSQMYNGSNMNIVWNGKAVYDGEYVNALFHILLPVICEFKPEMTFISAGFDACRFDPLGGLRLSTEIFGHLAYFLSLHSQMYQVESNFTKNRPGSLILALEGGYHLTMIAKSMSHCIRALLGESIRPMTNDTTVSVRNCRSLLDSIRKNQEYWKNLRFYDPIPTYCTEEMYLKDLKKQRLIQEAKANPRVLRSADNTPTSRSENTSRRDDSFLSQNNSVCSKRDSSFTNFPDQPIVLEMQEPSEPTPYFAVTPKKWCEHLEQCVDPMQDLKINMKEPCLECGSSQENWICLICYKTYCSRFVKEHMVKHYEKEGHNIALSYSDVSVWCFECDSYIDNEKTSKAVDLMTKTKFP